MENQRPGYCGRFPLATPCSFASLKLWRSGSGLTDARHRLGLQSYGSHDGKQPRYTIYFEMGSNKKSVAYATNYFGGFTALWEQST